MISLDGLAYVDVLPLQPPFPDGGHCSITIGDRDLVVSTADGERITHLFSGHFIGRYVVLSCAPDGERIRVQLVCS